MVHRDHINLSTTLFYFVILALGYAGVRVEYGNYTYFPFLFGSLLPDLDIAIYDKGHRFRSPAHNLGYALLSSAIFAASAAASRFIPQPLWAERVSLGASALALASLGWTAHLAGDFIQGGMKFFNKRIGLRRMTWDIYYGPSTSLFNFSYAGSYIGWFLSSSAILSVYLSYRIMGGGYIHLIPIALFFVCAVQGGAARALKVFFTWSAMAGAVYIFAGAAPVFSWLKF